MKTPEERIAAALYRSLWGEYESEDEEHMEEQPEEWFDPPMVLARNVLAADPTIAADLELAEKVRAGKTSPRLFWLDRVEDESGVSGTGHVAQGVVFFDGVVALRWMTEYRSSAIYASLDDVERIHGHGGKTRIVFADAIEDALR